MSKTSKTEASYEPSWDPDKGPTDSQVDTARRVLRADYWTSIRGSAKCIADDLRGGALEPRDVDDRIHEDADGSYWTIYTHANYQAIMCSDHDPWEDVEYAGGIGDDITKAMPILAYYCVRHDLREQVEAELGCAPEDYERENAASGDDE